MSADDRTLLERAVDPTPPEPDDAEQSDDTLADRPGISARKTTIGGEQVDLADPQTTITFEDEHGLLSGSHGRPRPREFWQAKQLGQTPPMELLKNQVKRQVLGGELIARADDDLQGPMADFADLVIDIYEGPHFQDKTLDNILQDAIDDLIDLGWAYWEPLPSEDGEFPVAGFKPIPPLQIQHNLADEGGDLLDDPAYYQVPYKRSGSQIDVTVSEPTELELDELVTMRYPMASGSDSTYGQSLATKVREWLELIVDVDVHNKRHYSDSQLPAGFLHFVGGLSADDLNEIEQDIREVSGDPHELVTTSTEGDASWIPVGESVVDLEAIEEQTWYYRLVFAAAGLPPSEFNKLDSSGFAKEIPALKKSIYANVTKPALDTIFDPQNSEVVEKLIAPSVGIDEVPFTLGLERFDPVQEQLEREQTMDEYQAGTASLNETRGEFGREATEFPVEVNGEEMNLADLPRDIVELVKPEVDSISLDDLNGDSDGETSMSSHSDPGAPDFESDPVLSEREAFDELGASYHPASVRQLEDTIDVQSSFLVSTAYSEQTNFMQLEFEREGEANAIYWYGDVPRYRFFNFLRASSKGGYFNEYIRGEYYYARLS